MILASHQPDFFPWMGYFYKMFQSDVFVFSDNVQFSKTGRHNYNDILTANGRQRFTLPIHYHCVNLNEIELAVDNAGAEKMVKTLWMAYRRAEHFHEAFPVIEELLMKAPEAESLADFNYKCILRIADLFGMAKDREFFKSSNLLLLQRRDARIIEMCKLIGADVYVSGEGAKDYHIEKDYADNGIKLIYSDYQPITYPQAWGQGETNLSVIDYVLNCGFKLPGRWKKMSWQT